MKVLVTGSSNGIGKAIAEKFLANGHEVHGFDIANPSIAHPNYTHYLVDVSSSPLPSIEGVEILINNAGVQDEEKAISVNLEGAIRISEEYAVQDKIKSVVFIASSSASTGAEFPRYAASKGGLLSYMKNLASRIAKYGATSNSISPGGVITDLNEHILKDEKLYAEVLDEAMLHKWASAEEIADWTYFVAVINKSMTAQDILIDNGEAAKFNFVW